MAIFDTEDAAGRIWEKAEEHYKGSEITEEVLEAVMNKYFKYSARQKRLILDFIKKQFEEQDILEPIDESCGKKEEPKEDKKEESNKPRYECREYITESKEFNGVYGVYDTVDNKFVQSGNKYVMLNSCIHLNESLNEADGKYKYIIGLSKKSVKELVDDESYDCYIESIITNKDELEDDSRIGFITTVNKDEAFVFNSKSDAESASGDIKEACKDQSYWKDFSVVVLLKEDKPLTEGKSVFKVNVSWLEQGSLSVEAESEEEAKKLVEQGNFPLPEGEYVEGSLKVI